MEPPPNRVRRTRVRLVEFVHGLCPSPRWVLIQLGFGLLFRIKYWICFFKVDCMSFFGQDAKKNENFRFFAVSGKVKTNIWINIDLRKQLDSWEIFDIFWFEKTNIQIYPIFQMIFNRQKLIVLCVCLAVVRFFMLVPRAWSHAVKIEALIIIMKSSKRGRNFRFQRSQLNLNSSLLKKEMTKYWNKMGNEDTQRKPYVGQVLSDWTYCRIEKSALSEGCFWRKF